MLVPEDVSHKHLHWSSLLLAEVPVAGFFVYQLEAFERFMHILITPLLWFCSCNGHVVTQC